MVLKEIKLKNGGTIKFEGLPYYLTITNGKKTWYWVRETGKYDGVSWSNRSNGQKVK